MSPRLLSSCLVLCVILYVAGCNTQTSLPISITVSPQSAAIAPGQTVRFSATVNSQMTGIASPATANDDPSGVSWSASVGTIDADGNYTAPSGTQSTSALVIAMSKRDRTKFAGARIHVVAPGQVSPTANPQVALYSIAPGAPANVSVQFGVDTNYGLTTWTQPSPESGALSLFVAGMKANMPYHMRAVVQFSDGTQFTDADHLFTTSADDSAPAPLITASTTPGMTPQGGVELLDLVTGTARPTITDLERQCSMDLHFGAQWKHCRIRSSCSLMAISSLISATRRLTGRTRSFRKWT